MELVRNMLIAVVGGQQLRSGVIWSHDPSGERT
jgi:hypothetical protein